MGSKRTAVPRLNLQGLGAPAPVPAGELESPRRPVQHAQGRVQQLAAPSPPPSMSKAGKFKMAGARNHEHNSRTGSKEKEKVSHYMITPRGSSSYKDILMTPRGGPPRSPALLETTEINANRHDQDIKPRSLALGVQIPPPQNTKRSQGVLEKIEEEDKDMSRLHSKIVQVRTLGKEVVSLSKEVAQLRTAIADAEIEIQARKLQVQDLLIVKQSLQATLKSLTTVQNDGAILNGVGAMGKRDDVLKELKVLVAEAVLIIQANHSQDDEKEEREEKESSSTLTVFETNRTMRRLDSIRSKLETAQAIMAASASSSLGDDADCNY
jgi:hypothetical protein